MDWLNYHDDDQYDNYDNLKVLGKGMVVGDRPKAIEFMIGVKTFWLPRSVIHPESSIANNAVLGDQGELVVAGWWATRHWF